MDSLLRERFSVGQLNQAIRPLLDKLNAWPLTRAAVGKFTTLHEHRPKPHQRYHHSCLSTGPTGCGETFLVCALGHQACRPVSQWHELINDATVADAVG